MTRRRFVKDGKIYKIEGTGLQSEQALKSGLSFQGKPIEFKLTDEWGWPIPEENGYSESRIHQMKDRFFFIVTLNVMRRLLQICPEFFCRDSPKQSAVFQYSIVHNEPPLKDLQSYYMPETRKCVSRDTDYFKIFVYTDARTRKGGFQNDS